jgi:glycosyltransferase involved in cell wall biosynthesis
MRTVLHVLPHPGGGGETYVDALEAMDDYGFERVYLARSPLPADALRSLPRTFWSSLRSADVLHVHGEVAGGICLPALVARRSVVTLHGLHLLRRAEGTKRRLAVANLRLILRAAKRTICVSAAEQDEVLALVPTAPSRLVVIHNGVDSDDPPSVEERASARAELGLGDAVVAGLYLGSLDAHKDPLTVARAAVKVAESEPFVLLVAGDGPLRPQLEELTRESPAVRMLGYRSHTRALLAATDLFVLPSLREGLSFSVLEAMAAGLPPVVSDTPGNPEAVGDSGIVVPVGDEDAFAAAFSRLKAPGERRALGDRARERVRERFSLAEMIQRTHDLYDGLGKAVW